MTGFISYTMHYIHPKSRNRFCYVLTKKNHQVWVYFIKKIPAFWMGIITVFVEMSKFSNNYSTHPGIENPVTQGSGQVSQLNSGRFSAGPLCTRQPSGFRPQHSRGAIYSGTAGTHRGQH